ncbi:hypothetical protein FKM82_024715 [Ascaphus truei]
MYNIKQHINCNSTNVIYLLECPCGLQYVGTTTRSIKRRLYEDVYNITKGLITHNVSNPFLQVHDRDPPAGLKCMAIEALAPNWRGGNINILPGQKKRSPFGYMSSRRWHLWVLISSSTSKHFLINK